MLYKSYLHCFERSVISSLSAGPCARRQGLFQLELCSPVTKELKRDSFFPSHHSSNGNGGLRLVKQKVFASKKHHILEWENGVGSTNNFTPSSAFMVPLRWSHLWTPWGPFKFHIHHILFSQMLLLPLDILNGPCIFSLGTKTPSWPWPASPGTHTLPGPGSSLAVSLMDPTTSTCFARAFGPQGWGGSLTQGVRYERLYISLPYTAPAQSELQIISNSRGKKNI